mgnify:CR=1 FL=1
MTNYSTLKSTGAPGFPPGFIIPWANNSVPVGFLVCDGSNVNRTTYADLFAVIGTTYGAGNGSTTFGLPSLDGRQLLFDGTGGDGSTTNSVGGTAGSATVDPTNNVTLSNNQTIANNITVSGNVVDTTLTLSQIPSHSHAVTTNFVLGTNDNSRNTNNVADGGQGNVSPQPSFATESQGGDGAHNHNHNIQVNAASIGGNVALGYNDITALYSSTKLRALIKT